MTSHGRQILDEARAVVGAADALRDPARWLASAQAGVVRLGYSRSTAFDTAPRLVSAATEARPELRVEVREVPSRQLPQALRDGDVDVALSLWAHDTDQLFAHTLRRLRSGVILRAGDALAGRAEVALGDLAGRSLVMHRREDAPARHDATLAACAEAGVEPEDRHGPPAVRPAVHRRRAGAGRPDRVGVDPRRAAGRTDVGPAGLGRPRAAGGPARGPCAGASGARRVPRRGPDLGRRAAVSAQGLHLGQCGTRVKGMVTRTVSRNAGAGLACRRRATAQEPARAVSASPGAADVGVALTFARGQGTARSTFAHCESAARRRSAPPIVLWRISGGGTRLVGRQRDRC